MSEGNIERRKQTKEQKKRNRKEKSSNNEGTGKDEISKQKKAWV